MEVDTITQIIKDMEISKPISLKFRFVKRCFPEINIGEIDDYVVILPINYYKYLTYFTYIESWMHFSEFTDRIVVVKLMPFDLCIDKPIRYAIPEMREYHLTYN